MGGLAGGSGKGCEANSSEVHACVCEGGFGEVAGTSGAEGIRLCCEEVELRECGWGCAGGPTLIVLSWSRVKRPNSSARRRSSTSSLLELI
jgi:hypothetical protein